MNERPKTDLFADRCRGCGVRFTPPVAEKLALHLTGKMQPCRDAYIEDDRLAKFDGPTLAIVDTLHVDRSTSRKTFFVRGTSPAGVPVELALCHSKGEAEKLIEERRKRKCELC